MHPVPSLLLPPVGFKQSLKDVSSARTMPFLWMLLEPVAYDLGAMTIPVPFRVIDALVIPGVFTARGNCNGNYSKACYTFRTRSVSCPGSDKESALGFGDIP